MWSIPWLQEENGAPNKSGANDENNSLNLSLHRWWGIQANLNRNNAPGRGPSMYESPEAKQAVSFKGNWKLGCLGGSVC